MLSTRLIPRLLKRLCQVLAILATSSARGLRILVTCFRHFVTKLKIRDFSRHGDPDSTTFSPADCCTVPTSTSGVRCSPANLPLPLHNRQITLASAASSTQDVLSSSMPTFPPVPCIPQQLTSPPQVSSNASSSSAPDTNTKLIPFAANDISRYENRPLVDTTQKRDGIPALMRRFPNESCPWLSGDWKACVHPEGVLYLYNDRRKQPWIAACSSCSTDM
ncbi:hypothetical protein BDR07DRAFT_908472 [Suillus spraguei]|nr:hypothetical protein BDR07DRAFT_908472 [Suillus spraguei]